MTRDCSPSRRISPSDVGFEVGRAAASDDGKNDGRSTMMRMNVRSWLPVMAMAAVCACALSWRAGAESGATGAMRAPATSVAVVNLERLRAGLTEFQERDAAVRQKALELGVYFQEREKDMALISEEINELPPDSELRREKMMERLRLGASSRAEYEVQTELFSIEKGRVIREMFTKARGAVAEIAQREGWDVVLWDHEGNLALLFEEDMPETSEPPDISYGAVNRRIVGRTVAYTSPRADITQLVIDTMNNAYAAGQ